MWESQLIEAKLQRLGQGGKVCGHLSAHEGGRLLDGRTIAGGLLARLFAVFRKKKSPTLRVVK